MLVRLFYGIKWHVQVAKYPEFIVQGCSPDILLFTVSAGLLCEVDRGLALMWLFDHFDRYSRMLIIRK